MSRVPIELPRAVRGAVTFVARDNMSGFFYFRTSKTMTYTHAVMVDGPLDGEGSGGVWSWHQSAAAAQDGVRKAARAYRVVEVSEAVPARLADGTLTPAGAELAGVATPPPAEVVEARAVAELGEALAAAVLDTPAEVAPRLSEWPPGPARVGLNRPPFPAGGDAEQDDPGRWSQPPLPLFAPALPVGA